MRKLISILLLAIFGMPSASTLLILKSKSEADLPACCRREGKHHCVMSTAIQHLLAGREPALLAPLDKCPYCPEAILSLHPSNGFMPPPGRVIYAGLVSHPAVVVQVKCKRRIAQERAHGKRGPPVSLL